MVCREVPVTPCFAPRHPSNDLHRPPACPWGISTVAESPTDRLSSQTGFTGTAGAYPNICTTFSGG